MQRALGFDVYSDQRKYYVAYPDAYQKKGERDTARWNDGRGTLESSLQEIDDVLYIVEMIAEIERSVALDASRIYVTGATCTSIGTVMLCLVCSCHMWPPIYMIFTSKAEP